jgi:hypothetical protein
MAAAGADARYPGVGACLGGGDPGGRERLGLYRRLVRSGHDRAHDRHSHRGLDGDGPLAAMMLGTAAPPADGAAAGGIPPAPPAAPGAGTRTSTGTGGQPQGKRWLAAQGRFGRPYFATAGLADVAATSGTVILSWYVAALIVAGVAGGAGGHGLGADVLGVVAGGLLRAAGGSPRTGWLRRVPDASRLVPATRSWPCWFWVIQRISRSARARRSRRFPNNSRGWATTSATTSGGRSLRAWRRLSSSR